MLQYRSEQGKILKQCLWDGDANEDGRRKILPCFKDSDVP